MSDPNAPKLRPSGNLRLAGLGMELAGAVIGGSLLGYWLDRRLGTGPRWLVICASIGVVGGLYNLIRQAMQETSGTRRKDAGPHDGGSGAGP